MDRIVAELSRQIKHLVIETTDTTLSAFNQYMNGSCTIILLLPMLLSMAILGVKARRISTICLILLFVPSYVSKMLRLIQTITDATESHFALSILHEYAKILNMIMNNIPPTLIVLGLVFYATASLFKHSAKVLYAFLLASYYHSELFNPTITAYFHTAAFLKTLLILPLIICVLWFQTLNLFVASFLFAFSGIWGLLSLTEQPDGSVRNSIKLMSILNDMLAPNYRTTRFLTIYFGMVVAVSIFVQYALRTSKLPKTCLESVKVHSHKPKYLH